MAWSNPYDNYYKTLTTQDYNPVYVGSRIRIYKNNSVITGVVTDTAETYCLYRNDDTGLIEQSLWSQIEVDNRAFAAGEVVQRYPIASSIKGIVAAINEPQIVFVAPDGTEYVSLTSEVYKPAGPPVQYGDR